MTKTRQNNVNIKLPYKKLSTDIFWRKILRFLSSLSSNRDKELTKSELDVFVRFLKLPVSFEHRMFSRIAKNKIREECRKEGWVLSSMNLNNKLYSLEDKGYLIKDQDGVVYLNPTIRNIWKNLKQVEGEPMSLNVLIQFENVPEKGKEGDGATKG